MIAPDDSPHPPGAELSSAGKEHPPPNADQSKCKNAAQPNLRNVLRAHCAEISAHKESSGQEQSDAQVRIALAVVFPESEDANRRKQCAQGGALGLVLVHSQQPDERRNKQNAAADTHEAREY